LSTLAGGSLALIAALLFWPKWEESESPGIIAAALRANRKYVESVAAYLVRAKPFTGEAVVAKREAERANSRAAASLQRLTSEPARQRRNVERVATLTTYNQRLTRAVTVLAQHLNKRPKLTKPGLEAVAGEIAESIGTLAEKIQARETVEPGGRLQVETPADAAADEALVYGQLARIATEVEAIRLAAAGSVPDGA
jgi:uncharacterized membrane protein YccC